MVIKSEDRYKTVFTFNNVNYCFKRFSFGLKDSSDIFYRCIATILREIKNTNNIKNFVDDVLIDAKSFDQFYNSISELLTLLRKYNLKLNEKNAHFLKKKVKFSGCIVSKDGYSAEPQNRQAVKDIQPPRSKKELSVSQDRFVWLRDLFRRI